MVLAERGGIVHSSLANARDCHVKLSVVGRDDQPVVAVNTPIKDVAAI